MPISPAKGLAPRLFSVSRRSGLSILPLSATATAALTTSSAAMSASGYRPRYIDIGINLADPIFRGRYYGKQRHPDDLASVIQRAHDVGCTKLIVTGSSFKSSRDALKLTQEFPGVVFATAGIHPCSSAIFEAGHPHHHEADDDEHVAACGADPTQPHANDGEIDAAKSTQIVADLHALIETAPAGVLVAFGEIGLDYDRLHYCSASTQRHSFAAQLALAASLSHPLPLFLHSRACHADFVRLLKEQFGPRLESLACGAVVHSFTGTVAEAEELMNLGLYMGVNGCSLKTVENCEVLKAIRLDRLMIETDGPWCEVRPSHEGWRYLVEAAEAAKAQQAELEAGEAEQRQAQEQAKEQAKEEQVEQVEQVPETSAAKKRMPTPKKNKQQPQLKKKESVVPERFKVVKKEKWEEGVMIKGRNEPCMIERVATIIAAVKGVPVEQVCEAAWANTVKVFGLEA